MSSVNGLLEPIQFANYVDPSRFGATYCTPVARTLLNAIPSDADRAEKHAIQVVVARAADVESEINLRESQGSAKVRPAMLAFGNSWSASNEILGGLGRVDGELGTKAREMSSTLFADGVTFVKLDARAAWSEGQRRLGRIDSEGLASDLNRLLGEEVVNAMRKTTTDLGEAIGAGETPREVVSTTALADCLDVFARAVAGYARVLAAKVDVADPASVERFLDAMGPLDEYRASRKGTSDQASVDQVPADQASTDPASTAPAASGAVVAPAHTGAAPAHAVVHQGPHAHAGHGGRGHHARAATAPSASPAPATPTGPTPPTAPTLPAHAAPTTPSPVPATVPPMTLHTP